MAVPVSEVASGDCMACDAAVWRAYMRYTTCSSLGPSCGVAAKSRCVGLGRGFCSDLSVLIAGGRDTVAIRRVGDR
jgi:hypothetical protein